MKSIHAQLVLCVLLKKNRNQGTQEKEIIFDD